MGVSIDSLPRLVIAPVDAVAMLGYPVGATRLTNGSVVVADRQGAGLVAFDSAGKFLRKIGRRGDGPGEFRIPEWLGQCGRDTLVVWDSRRSTASVFDSAGRFQRQFRFPVTPWKLSCSAAGLFALVAYPEAASGRSAENSPLYRSKLVVIDGLGHELRVFDSVPAGWNRPLSPVLAHAVDSRYVYLGFGDSARVIVVPVAGSGRNSLAFDLSPRRTTETHYRAAVERQVAPLSDVEARRRFSEQLLRIPGPRDLPYYRGLNLDPVGNLWITTSALGDGKTSILVVSADSQRQRFVTIPHEIELFEVGTNHLLGARMSAGGVPHIEVYGYRFDR